MKTAAKILAGAVILAALVWTSVFLYWHIQITSAIRTIEKNPTILRAPALSPQLTALQLLKESGCRATPYCVRAIDPSNDLILNGEMMELIRTWITLGRAVRDSSGMLQIDEETRADGEFLLKCEFLGKDTPEMRALRCRRLQEWWNEKGSRYHQWWRVWSSRCGR